jgi:hypothetical protein
LPGTQVGLVVAQQDVEARLALLDQVVFERQGFLFVFHQDVVDVHGFAHQRAGLGIGLGRGQDVGAYPRTQVLGFADVDDVALRVAVQIHPRPGGQGAYFLVQIHDLKCRCYVISGVRMGVERVKLSLFIRFGAHQVVHFPA